MLFDAKTQKWTELVKTKPNSGWEEWSRDGDYIYFLGAPPGGQQGVFRVRTSDRKLEQVASLKDFRQALGWGQWVPARAIYSQLQVHRAAADIYISVIHRLGAEHEPGPNHW